MKRRPAEAGLLIAQRQVGRDFPAVVVSYGATRLRIVGWEGLPMVFVSPAQYAPGRFDWGGCVAGLPVLLADRCVRDVDDTIDADGWRGLLWCAGELARFALGGYVAIYSRHLPPWVTEARQLAAEYAQDDGCWPPWWAQPGIEDVRRGA